MADTAAINVSKINIYVVVEQPPNPSAAILFIFPSYPVS